MAVALMKRYYTDLEAACGEIDAQHTTGAARLLALIERDYDALEGGQSLCLCVSFSTSTRSLFVEVITEMSCFRSMMIDWLSKTFALGQQDGTIKSVHDPVREADTALPLPERAQLAARVAQDPNRFRAALHILTPRLLH